MTDSSVEAVARDETGWLIEEDAGGGVIHWIALAKDRWPLTEVRDRRLGSYGRRSFERYLSPVVRVKDANEALRFARKEDAEAFIELFDRFLLCATATEHSWPALPSPERDPLREALAIAREALRANVAGSEALARHYKIDLCNDVENGSAYHKAKNALAAIDAALAPPPAQSGDRT